MQTREQDIQEEVRNLSAMKRSANEDLEIIKKDLALAVKHLKEVEETKRRAAAKLESEEAVLLLDGLAAEIEKLNAADVRLYLNLISVQEEQLQTTKKLEEKCEVTKESIKNIKSKKESAKAELASVQRDIVSYNDCIGAMKCLRPQQCVICISAAATHAFLPCGHRSVCEQCAKKFKAGNPCPICKKPIDDAIKIFLDGPE